MTSYFSWKFCFLVVEVDQFLVQWLIEQHEILQASLDIGMFPEPMLSSAEVVGCCETSSACSA